MIFSAAIKNGELKFLVKIPMRYAYIIYTLLVSLPVGHAQNYVNVILLMFRDFLVSLS